MPFGHAFSDRIQKVKTSYSAVLLTYKTPPSKDHFSGKAEGTAPGNYTIPRLSIKFQPTAHFPPQLVEELHMQASRKDIVLKYRWFKELSKPKGRLIPVVKLIYH